MTSVLHLKAKLPTPLVCLADLAYNYWEFGQLVTIKLDIRQRAVRVQVGRVQVGRSQLYLLDTDCSDNDPLDRRTTSHLYGGNPEARLAQAMVLGIGGVRMLHTLGLNGGTLDGWWAEGYGAGSAGQVALGWAIGKANPAADPDGQGHQDTDSLYDLLEHQIAPVYYQRDSAGRPRQWIAMMKASICSCAPHYTSDRMVADYLSQMYTPRPDPVAVSSLL